MSTDCYSNIHSPPPATDNSLYIVASSDSSVQHPHLRWRVTTTAVVADLHWNVARCCDYPMLDAEAAAAADKLIDEWRGRSMSPMWGGRFNVDCCWDLSHARTLDDARLLSAVLYRRCRLFRRHAVGPLVSYMGVRPCTRTNSSSLYGATMKLFPDHSATASVGYFKYILKFQLSVW